MFSREYITIFQSRALDFSGFSSDRATDGGDSRRRHSRLLHWVLQPSWDGPTPPLGPAQSREAALQLDLSPLSSLCLRLLGDVSLPCWLPGLPCILLSFFCVTSSCFILYLSPMSCSSSEETHLSPSQIENLDCFCRPAGPVTTSNTSCSSRTREPASVSESDLHSHLSPSEVRSPFNPWL